jgi:hypothetical protein
MTDGDADGFIFQAGPAEDEPAAAIPLARCGGIVPM